MNQFSNLLLDQYSLNGSSSNFDKEDYLDFLYDQYLSAIHLNKIAENTSFQTYLESCLSTLDWRINYDIPSAFLLGYIVSESSKKELLELCKMSKDAIIQYLTSIKKKSYMSL